MIRFIVRLAEPADVEAIEVVASAAWRDTYQGLLRPETIEKYLERAYARPRLLQRVQDNRFLLAVSETAVVAFADAAVLPERIELRALYATPAERGKGAGTALLAHLLRDFPFRAVSADVLLGNLKGEVFYRRRGFVPRETIEADLFGEPVTERRWWLDAPGLAGR